MAPSRGRKPMASQRASGIPRLSIVLGVGAIALSVVAVAALLSSAGSSPGASLAGAATSSSSTNAASTPTSSSHPGALSADPTAGAPTTPPASPAPPPSGAPVAVRAGPFVGDLMIADRQNGRIIIVDAAGTIRWRFPVAGSLLPGQSFAADDAFLAPDGKTITANEEGHEVIVRIDIATRRVIWEYGRYNVAGRGAGELHTPDDAYPLANGDVIVADIFNCRVIEIDPAKHITRQWGRTGVCTGKPPNTYANPNGDTPLPDGGLLITEITGSRVVRLDAAGHVVFDVHVPTAYPSDAHLDAKGNILVVDYANPGAIIRLDPHGHVLWRYKPTSGAGRLNHPSLAIDLANGLVAVNDDFRHRVLVIDPKTNRIVWQYGHTDRHGRTNGYLFTPDGIDVIPPAVAATL